MNIELQSWNIPFPMSNPWDWNGNISPTCRAMDSWSWILDHSLSSAREAPFLHVFYVIYSWRARPGPGKLIISLLLQLKVEDALYHSVTMFLSAPPDTQIWFQHPHQVIHKHQQLQLQGIPCPFLSYECICKNAAFTHTDTHIHINKNKSKRHNLKCPPCFK